MKQLSNMQRKVYDRLRDHHQRNGDLPDLAAFARADELLTEGTHGKKTVPSPPALPWRALHIEGKWRADETRLRVRLAVRR